MDIGRHGQTDYSLPVQSPEAPRRKAQRAWSLWAAWVCHVRPSLICLLPRYECVDFNLSANKTKICSLCRTRRTICISKFSHSERDHCNRRQTRNLSIQLTQGTQVGYENIVSIRCSCLAVCPHAFHAALARSISLNKFWQGFRKEQRGARLTLSSRASVVSDPAW